MSDSELIDWEQLEMIFGEEEDELDEDMVELYQEFVEDAKERFGIIDGLSFSDEKDQIAKESHKLKGSASNFGFVKVAGLLAGIEDNIATISEEDVNRDVAAARNFFDASHAEVLSKFPTLSNA